MKKWENDEDGSLMKRRQKKGGKSGRRESRN